jgi:hypothetical protein
MRFLAVTVAQRPAILHYDEMPFYCHTHEPIYFTRDRKRERFEKLVRWWNDAHKLAIEYYPEATHFLDVGTYYLSQTTSLRRLVLRYERLQCPEIILAGNVLYRKKVGPLELHATYDTLGFPELVKLFGIGFNRFSSKDQLIQLNYVAQPFIYPVEYWQKHPFHIRQDIQNDEDIPIWYMDFCDESGAPVFVDPGIRFYRDESNSDVIVNLTKRLRIYAGQKIGASRSRS